MGKSLKMSFTCGDSGAVCRGGASRGGCCGQNGGIRKSAKTRTDGNGGFGVAEGPEIWRGPRPWRCFSARGSLGEVGREVHPREEVAAVFGDIHFDFVGGPGRFFGTSMLASRRPEVVPYFGGLWRR